MQDMNNILVEGRLTKDPYVGKSKNGKDFKAFSIANNRYFKRSDDADWEQRTTFLSATVFNGKSETFNAKKGDRVRLEGMLQETDKGFMIDVKNYSIIERYQK